jgi:hypothetical protein
MLYGDVDYSGVYQKFNPRCNGFFHLHFLNVAMFDTRVVNL